MSKQADILTDFEIPEHLHYMSHEGPQTIIMINTKNNTLLKFEDLYAEAIMFLIKSPSTTKLLAHLKTLYPDLDDNFLSNEIRKLTAFISAT